LGVLNAGPVFGHDANSNVPDDFPSVRITDDIAEQQAG